MCDSSCDNERPYTLAFLEPELYVRLSEVYLSAPSLKIGSSLYLPDESGPPFAKSSLDDRPTSMYLALSSMLSIFTVAVLYNVAFPEAMPITMESWAS